MSDAQGPKNDDDADRTAPASEGVPAAEQAPTSGSDADITRGGPDPDTAVFSADGADGYEDDAAPGSANADDTGSASDTSAPSAAGAVGADDRGAATSSGTSEEPDYEALAAELDRLEADTATAAPVAPGARESTADDKAADPWFEPSTSETFSASRPQPTAVDEPDATPDAAPATTAAPGPIFVQAPEPPRKRGNRGASGLIGLVAAIVFAVLFAGASYLWQIFLSQVGAAGDAATALDDFATEVLLQPQFWFTVVAFWLAFWLLGAFVNRARWWSWVVLGVIVALLTYAGHIAGHFLDAPFWNLTGSEGLTLLGNTVFAPLALLAFILAREVTIWFGAWVSRRGARVTKLNDEEREEYDKVMAEGPKAP